MFSLPFSMCVCVCVCTHTCVYACARAQVCGVCILFACIVGWLHGALRVADFNWCLTASVSVWMPGGSE
jgi:hypothetical protein